MKQNRIPIVSPMGISYIGATQHRIICDMIRYGNGVWKFHTSSDKRAALEKLCTRLLVEKVKVGFDPETKKEKVIYRLVPGIKIQTELYGGEGLMNR